jgi:hypothetical protein
MREDETRGEVPHRVKMLESLGLLVHHNYVYEGEVGKDRHRVDLLDTVSSVYLPLTTLEWCLTSMREPPPGYESFYVGPCCGITGELQDIWNGIFRDGGWADAADLLRVGELARQHEGFDEFQPLDEYNFRKLVQRWDGGEYNGPWFKVGIVFNAVEPYLKPRSYENPRSHGTHETEEQKLTSRLGDALRSIRVDDLFAPSGHEMVDAAHSAQREVNRAQVAPLAKKLVDVLGEVTFEGYAIAEPGAKEPMANSYGPCIYLTREAGERVLELWDRQGGRGEARVVPAHIKDGELVLEEA